MKSLVNVNVSGPDMEIAHYDILFVGIIPGKIEVDKMYNWNVAGARENAATAGQAGGKPPDGNSGFSPHAVPNGRKGLDAVLAPAFMPRL